MLQKAATTSVPVSVPVAATMPVFPSRPMHLPDLSDKGMWVIERLRVRFPHLQDAQLASWLRSFISHTDYCFIHTPGAIACAQLMRDGMSPIPTAEEKFVLAHAQDNIPEALSLYGDLARWAERLGCRNLTVLTFSDVPATMLVERFGRVSIRQTKYVRVARGSDPGD